MGNTVQISVVARFTGGEALSSRQKPAGLFIPSSPPRKGRPLGSDSLKQINALKTPHKWGNYKNLALLNGIGEFGVFADIQMRRLDMEMAQLGVYLFGAAFVVAVIVPIVIYNSLINKKNQVENAFGGMDVQLKKRYDLIPGLVESVKQYMKHESSVLDKLTQLRAQALQGGLLLKTR